MKVTAALIAASAAMVAPAMASATTIDFTNVSATWFDVEDGSNINFSGQGTSAAEVRWGVPQQGAQSGYRYETLPIASLEVDPLTDTSAVVNIGQFTHFNFPISSGSGASAVKLRLTTDVLVDDVLFGTVDFIYAFDHFETSNGANPCANGEPNYSGVNINGCADRVQVNFNQASGAFTIDDVDYALDVRGFLVGDSPVDMFWTVEQETNVAYLRGQVVLRSNAGAVPEPATWAMMIGGFGLAGGAMRRRATSLRFA